MPDAGRINAYITDTATAHEHTTEFVTLLRQAVADTAPAIAD